MLTSRNKIIEEIYVAEELTSRAGKKNPTVASQFRKDLKNLMKILYSKEPAYIRCIKPNMEKSPGKLSKFY
jgi:myosin-1